MQLYLKQFNSIQFIYKTTRLVLVKFYLLTLILIKTLIYAQTTKHYSIAVNSSSAYLFN